MITENFYKFKIIEDCCSSLYRLLCCLEDNNIKFQIDDKKEDSIILRPLEFIENYKIINKFLGNEIELLYRNGTSLRKKSLELDQNNYICFYDQYFINPFTGEWYDKNKKECGTFTMALINYSKCGRRKNYIKLSDAMREVINYGLLQKDIINLQLRNKSVEKYYPELKYSVFKIKFTGKNPKSDFEEFIADPTYSRCIPWSENEEYGIWIWPERFFRDQMKNYPQGELILNDTKNYKLNISRKKLIGNAYILRSENLKDIFFYNNEDANQYIEIEVENCDDPSILYYDKYLLCNEKQKKDIETLLELVRDYGFISPNKTKRAKLEEYGWENIIEMPS